MNGIYFFVVWNLALWCKDKILKDLQEKFTIIRCINVCWDKKDFDHNLEILYGSKLEKGSIKSSFCGKGPFLLVIVRDENERFEYRTTSSGKELVNINTFDCKELYRKWTGGAHKIHCSNTIEETSHDLVTLLGIKKYEDIVNYPYETCMENVKSLIGFDSLNDLCDSLKAFGDNFTIQNEDSIIIVAKNKINVLRFINPEREYTSCSGVLKLKDAEIKYYIFGAEEGELPEGFYDQYELHEKGYAEFMKENILKYTDFVIDGDLVDEGVASFLIENGFSTTLQKKNTVKHYRVNGIYVLKDKLNLAAAFIRYKFFDKGSK